MNIFKNPERKEWETILRRPETDLSDICEKTEAIIEEVINSGDEALRKYTRLFDGADLDIFALSPEELKEAGNGIGENLKAAISEAYSNIWDFHMLQVGDPPPMERIPGVRCWQKSIPIQSVGLYIPGGTAPLLSTVLMLGIPARIAGCREIVLCTPPGKDGTINPAVLYTASLLEINKIYKLGGAQAIAAMAYGTETIPRVNKIFGPGNLYVTTAKLLVSKNKTAIDMPAGPSEVAIIADASCNPEFIAADLLSQAEHGPDSQVMLFIQDETVVDKILKELQYQTEKLPRKEVAGAALRNSAIIVVDHRDELIEMVNLYAPEHLIIATADYREISERIVNAGSVFLGSYTPESAGDYASGTNHTLPTNGWAHSYGGLNVDSFVKKITFQEITEEGLMRIGKTIMTLAEAEELDGHRNAVYVRMRKK